MSFLDEWRHGYGTAGLVIAGLLAVSIMYFAASTQPIRNFNNSTNATLYSGPDARVPPHFISFPQAGLSLVMLFAVMYLGLQAGKARGDFIDIREALDTVQKYCDDMRARKQPDYMNAEIRYNVFNTLPRVFTEHAEPIPKRWTVVCEFNYPPADGIPTKFGVFHVHPKTAKMMAATWRFSEVTDAEKCSRCGKEYDERILETADFAATKYAVGQISSARRGERT